MHHKFLTLSDTKKKKTLLALLIWHSALNKHVSLVGAGKGCEVGMVEGRSEWIMETNQWDIDLKIVTSVLVKQINEMLDKWWDIDLKIVTSVLVKQINEMLDK